jgi:branched-subunit amino acid transport protein AzlD
MVNLDVAEALLFVGVIALGTFAIRALPFLLFPENRATPPFVHYLGKVFPYSVIGMLVVYCLRNANPLNPPYALPEVISLLAILALQLKLKNMLISIGGGTLIFMLLVQQVFI